MGFSSLTYMMPTFKILASCYAWNPSKSFRWVVVVSTVSLVFSFSQAEQFECNDLTSSRAQKIPWPHHYARRNIWEFLQSPIFSKTKCTECEITFNS